MADRDLSKLRSRTHSYLRRDDTPGEWLDRYIIWGLKAKNVVHPKKAKQAAAEHDSMQSVVTWLEENAPDQSRFKELLRALWSSNSQLWAIEDKIRELDKDVFPLDPGEELGEKRAEYMGLARQVYRINDRRSRIKAYLNEMFGYNAEVKEYPKYEGTDDE